MISTLPFFSSFSETVTAWAWAVILDSQLFKNQTQLVPACRMKLKEEKIPSEPSE
jgi:hypothetical protein